MILPRLRLQDLLDWIAKRPEDPVTMLSPYPKLASLASVIGEVGPYTVEQEVIAVTLVDQGIVTVWIRRNRREESHSNEALQIRWIAPLLRAVAFESQDGQSSLMFGVKSKGILGSALFVWK